MIELLIQLMKERPQHNMMLRLLDELLEIYKKVSARRYLTARWMIRAGRYIQVPQGLGRISTLENLIRNYQETAFWIDSECTGVPFGYLWISLL